MLDAAKLIARRLNFDRVLRTRFHSRRGYWQVVSDRNEPALRSALSLSLGEARDLLAAFWAKLTQQEMPQRPAITQKSRIAYFPTAVLRGANSAYISQQNSIYLDIPSGERNWSRNYSTHGRKKAWRADC